MSGVKGLRSERGVQSVVNVGLIESKHLNWKRSIPEQPMHTNKEPTRARCLGGFMIDPGCKRYSAQDQNGGLVEIEKFHGSAAAYHSTLERHARFTACLLSAPLSNCAAYQPTQDQYKQHGWV